MAKIKNGYFGQQWTSTISELVPLQTSHLKLRLLPGRIVGLAVGVSLGVREVPSSIPREAYLTSFTTNIAVGMWSLL